MYVKLVYDDSVLYSRLDDSDEKLKDHDELIKELQKKLENLVTNTQLEFMQSELTKEFENKINEMNNKFQNLLKQFNTTVEQVQNLSNTVNSKVNELTEYVDNKTQQNYDNFMGALSRDHSRLETAEEKIAECEDKVNSHKKKINECQSNIQHLASSIANLNNTDVIVDKNLHANLKDPINFVKNNFRKIHEELAKLKMSNPPPIAAKSGLNDTLSAILQQQNSSSNRMQSSSQKPSILSPHIQKPGKSFSSQSTSQKQQPQQSQNIDQILGSGRSSNDTDIQEKSTKNETQEKIEPEPEHKSELKPEPEPKPKPEPNKESIEDDIPPKPPKQEQKMPSTPIETNTTTSSTTNTNNNSQNVTFPTTPKKSPSVSINQQSKTPQPHSQSQTRKMHDFIPYDLTKVRPYSDIQVHWQDRPRLPEIRPFITIEEAVDHIYKLQPFIQAYLSAMHGKLVESWGQIQQKVDKNLVEKMFERMQGIVADINLALNKLENEVQQTATRKEINGFLEELMKSHRSDGQTAVGRVRCIACGRETAQITGAMTDAEVERAFGPNTPNSLVRGVSNHKPGVSYSSTDGFDSAIVEEPRSKRPPQGVLSQSQVQQPSNKTKAKFQ